jgi:toxin ParE1/3/4
MKSVRFLASARRELLAEVVYYSGSATGLGVKFVRAVEQALAIAVHFPHAGSLGPAGTRKVMVKGFPFSVVYLQEKEGITVIAVAHHARRPGYWVDRLECI